MRLGWDLLAVPAAAGLMALGAASLGASAYRIGGAAATGAAGAALCIAYGRLPAGAAGDGPKKQPLLPPPPPPKPDSPVPPVQPVLPVLQHREVAPKPAPHPKPPHPADPTPAVAQPVAPPDQPPLSAAPAPPELKLQAAPFKHAQQVGALVVPAGAHVVINPLPRQPPALADVQAAILYDTTMMAVAAKQKEIAALELEFASTTQVVDAMDVKAGGRLDINPAAAANAPDCRPSRTAGRAGAAEREGGCAAVAARRR